MQAVRSKQLRNIYIQRNYKDLLLVKKKEKKLLKIQSLPKVLRSQAMRSKNSDSDSESDSDSDSTMLDSDEPRHISFPSCAVPRTRNQNDHLRTMVLPFIVPLCLISCIHAYIPTSQSLPAFIGPTLNRWVLFYFAITHLKKTIHVVEWTITARTTQEYF